MINELPSQPSALLRLALGDLEEAENSGDYRVDMHVWHCPDRDDVCVVCLGGAVMAFSLNVAQDNFITDPRDSQWDKDTAWRLMALDAFRLGTLQIALSNLDVDRDKRRHLPELVEMAKYEEDPAEFKRNIRDLTILLEEAGL